jgi:hypothetical protein
MTTAGCVFTLGLRILVASGYKAKNPGQIAGVFAFQITIVLCRYCMYVHRTSQPLHEVIRRPGSGELHMAILQLLAGA